MATNVIYIHDLPFLSRRELCRILDADRRWEELGGIYMGYDITTLTLIGQAVLRDKSPTGELLNKFSEKNGTIRQLYKMLALMDHQRAMFILKSNGLSLEKNSPSGLSPIELQIYYDLQKSGTLPKDLPSFTSPSDPLEKNPTLESAACGSVAQDPTSPEPVEKNSIGISPQPKTLEDPPKDTPLSRGSHPQPLLPKNKGVRY